MIINLITFLKSAHILYKGIAIIQTRGETLMNPSNALSEIGYLIVRVSTALGTIPIQNAAVTVRGAQETNSEIVHSLTTNSDGQTARIPLPAPPKSNSSSPNMQAPYSTYSVDVFADGYAPLYVSNVPVFSSVISIQPAILLPLPEGSN